MAALAKESILYGIHFAGGEATLDWPRLEYAIRSARRHGVPVDYLETNASWCENATAAREGFLALKEAGLNGVLISASLFHLEFTPLERTNTAIAAAREVFGPGGVLVWTQEVLDRMNRHLDPDRTYPLSESCRRIGIDAAGFDLWRLHSYVRPGGRAAECLSAGLPRKRADDFQGASCASVLESTHHFHIDPQGRLYTGHCPGISVASIEQLHPILTEKETPVFWSLLQGGPYRLWKEKAGEFEPDEEGYAGKCHFCLELRKYLYNREAPPELRSEAYYSNQTRRAREI
jgi:hypothetical protein